MKKRDVLKTLKADFLKKQKMMCDEFELIVDYLQDMVE